MAELLDCRGLKCPQPVLKLAIKSSSIASGSLVEVLADCNTFPKDITKWCQDSGRVLISCVDEGGYHKATVQF